MKKILATQIKFALHRRHEDYEILIKRQARIIDWKLKKFLRSNQLLGINIRSAKNFILTVYQESRYHYSGHFRAALGGHDLPRPARRTGRCL